MLLQVSYPGAADYAPFLGFNTCAKPLAVSWAARGATGETPAGSGEPRAKTGSRPMPRRAGPVQHFDAAGFSRFFVSLFPQATAAHLAHAIGWPASTAEKWLRGETTPRAPAIAAMICVFGPSFLVACLECPAPWCADAARRERRAALEAELSAMID